MADTRAVVLHSSWRGRLTAAIGPVVLLIWGGYGALLGGLQIFNAILLLAGAGLGLVVLFDYPIWASIGPDGVTRRCALRKERLGWDQVRTIARPGARQRLLGFGRGEVNVNRATVPPGALAWSLRSASGHTCWSIGSRAPWSTRRSKTA